MSATKALTPGQKLNQKILYIIVWGATAAYTGALVASNFAYSLSTWAIICALLAGVSMISTVVLQGSWRFAFHSLMGPVAGIVGGALIGWLVYASENFYPAAFVSALGIGALTLSTVAAYGKRLTKTSLARSCVHWAMFLSLFCTGVALLTGGLEDLPMYQPDFAAVLSMWATLMIIASLEG